MTLKIREKVNRRLLRLLMTLGLMLILLVAIGIFLYLRVDSLLNIYLEEQGKKQAETLSEVTSRQFEGELKALATVASEFSKIEEVSVDALQAVQDADPDSRIGVQRVDGTPFFGVSYMVSDFPCIGSAIHGEQAISYLQGRGLLFCVPAFRDRNVAYVLYRFYPESTLYERFGMSSYGGLGRALVIDRSGHVVISALPEGSPDKTLFTEQSVVDGFSELTRELYTTGSAATFRKTGDTELMLYAAEITGSDFYLQGYVPKSVVHEGVKYIKMMVALVFIVLAALVFLGGFLLTRLEIRTQESEHLKAVSLIEKQSNAAKSDFLANMSHEIRTPINAILGMNEMVLRESGDEKIRTYAGNIENAGKNLLSIINDILDFSKIEAGRMEITEAPYQLSSVLNDVSNMIGFRSKSKDLDFVVNVDETIPDALYGDEVRIRQCMINLLSNAVKYTNKGSVTLTVGGERVERPVTPSDAEQDPAKTAPEAVTTDDATTQDLLLSVTVEDTGIGIRDEDIDKLFDKFERVDLKQNNTVEGTGLGLAITHNILQLMGGNIRVESEYGHGSRFIMTLPQKVLSDVPIGNFRAKFEDGTQDTKAYRETFHAPTAIVLIVDDTAINLTVIKGLLKSTELQLDLVTSGAEALECAKAKAYDLILMDQRMPNMDGTETMMHIRSQLNGMNRKTPIIALTADAVQGAKARYLQAGFTDYLSKPVEGAALEAALMKYLPQEKVVRVLEKIDARKMKTKKAAPEPVDEAPVSEQAAEGPEEGDLTEDGAMVRKIYRNIDELSYEDTQEYLESDDLILVTLTQILEDGPAHAKEIEESLKAGDWDLYTVKVHSLKSSARLIGATTLSKKALALEEAGNAIRSASAEDEVLSGKKEEAGKLTAELLSDYRTLLTKLSSFLGAGQAEEKEEIDLETLQEFYDSVLELASVYDLDTIDAMLHKIEDHKIPDAESEKFEALKMCIRNADWEGMKALLS